MAANFSLRSRILWSAAIVLFVFLGLAGLVLDQAFQRTAEQSVAEKLRIQIYGLLSVTEVDQGEILLPEALQEPRFNNPGSGLFALVRDGEGKEVWRSASGVALEFTSQQTRDQYLALLPGEDRFARMTEPDVFYLAYKVLWLGAGEESKEFVFVVMESVEGYQSQLNSFRSNLWGWLVLVGVVLILVQAAVMNWGLKPLGALARDLEAIENGKQDGLTAEYPNELTGVTKNLNILISSERTQREKYRTTMADLAHSIKTPLAILKNTAGQIGQVRSGTEAVSDEIRNTIDAQVDRMDEIVAYQLERAMSDASSLIKRAIEVEPVLVKLHQAMQKVYPNIAISLDVEPATFFGDERDLMEVLGNLIDNACKYSRSSVAITARKTEEVPLEITIVDDGPGIPVERREQVLARGTRMDSRAPGQGIGLAVVAEIIARYDGNIVIADSTFGGASVTVSFP